VIHHGLRELPAPARFGPLLGRALREAAVGLVEPGLTEEIASDFRAVQMPTLALVRPGPRVASRLDGQHYALFVRRAAAALGRYGVPVADAGDQTPLMAQQLLRDAPGYLLDWDYHLFASMVVARNRSGKQQTTEEVRRAQAVTSQGRENLTPTWLLEPGAPLAELAATRSSGAGALSVVVMANAVLPKNGAQQAAAWLQSALNGGERGRRVRSRRLPAPAISGLWRWRVPPSGRLCGRRCLAGRGVRLRRCGRHVRRGCTKGLPSLTGVWPRAWPSCW
jgi:hypothetical protein